MRGKEDEASKKQEEAEIKREESSTVLTQEILEPHLFSIREQFKKASKNFELAILDQEIKVLDGGKVILEVVGHMQEEIAEKMKPELASIIRQLTGVGRVMISVELKEEVESGSPKLYTNTDKLNHLLEKHPALAELQRKFGLEVDF